MGILIDGLPTILKSLRFAPSTARPIGTPHPSGEHAPLGPELPAIGRILAHLFPPPGGLWSSPRPWPATPSQCPARPRTQPGPPQKAKKTPAAAHSWQRRGAELLEQRPVSCQAFHWHPVRRTKKMASMARRSSTRGRWHPRGCDFPGGSNGWMRSHNSSGLRQSRRTSPDRHAWIRLLWERKCFPTGYP